MLVLLKIHLNHLKDGICECFFEKYTKFSFFNKLIFFITYNDEKCKP